MESTLVLIKPDAIVHELSVSIINQIQTLTNIKHFSTQPSSWRLKYLTQEQASELYAEHKDKWFFDRNIKHITSGPVILLHVQGDNVVQICREFVENFRETHADKIELPRNLIHATNHKDKVEHELKSVGFMEN